MSESLECIGSKSNMQTSLKAAYIENKAQLKGVEGGRACAFVNVGALQCLLCARWLGIVRCRAQANLAKALLPPATFQWNQVAVPRLRDFLHSTVLDVVYRRRVGIPTAAVHYPCA